MVDSPIASLEISVTLYMKLSGEIHFAASAESYPSFTHG